jgi:hypothetical protein
MTNYRKPLVPTININAHFVEIDKLVQEHEASGSTGNLFLEIRLVRQEVTEDGKRHHEYQVNTFDPFSDDPFSNHEPEEEAFNPITVVKPVLDFNPISTVRRPKDLSFGR